MLSISIYAQTREMSFSCWRGKMHACYWAISTSLEVARSLNWKALYSLVLKAILDVCNVMTTYK